MVISFAVRFHFRRLLEQLNFPPFWFRFESQPLDYKTAKNIKTFNFPARRGGWGGGGGGRLLPYLGYIGMSGPKGRVFQPFWS